MKGLRFISESNIDVPTSCHKRCDSQQGRMNKSPLATDGAHVEYSRTIYSAFILESRDRLASQRQAALVLERKKEGII